MDKKNIARSAKETKERAAFLLEELEGGDAVCLYGNLGAGKTTFVQGLALGLGIEGPVNSPTFNVLKVYPVLGNKKGIKRLYHVDCYRLRKAEELKELGFEEWIEDKKGLVAVEWAGKVKEILPKRRVDVKFKMLGKNTREMEIKRFFLGSK